MESVKAVVMAITLLTLCLLTSKTSARGNPGCCHNYIKIKIPFSEIKGYSVQKHTEMCRISAIIFVTKQGRLRCADPAKNWVMDYINRLRTEAQIVHKNSLAKN